MAFCDKCGKELRAGAKFCEECGATVEGKAAAPRADAVGIAATIEKPAGGKRRKKLPLILGVLLLLGVFRRGIPGLNTYIYKMRVPEGFVYIPAGEFTMGSPSSEKGRSDNETQHRVKISKGFYMKATEVTQGEWEDVMGSNPSYFTECGSDCPVERVSWDDAQEFIRKYNEKHGGGYRMPTEAEWEYAARAGSESAFHTGDITVTDCGNDPALARAGWYCGNSGNTTHSVGQKDPNAWGLYDMHGNVWEWVQDWYGDYPSGAVTDPTGPSSGSDRVYRGGGWVIGGAGYCRAAFRFGGDPGTRINNLGVRLVRALP